MFSFFSEYNTAQRIINKHYHVIFYAENAYYFQYFRHLFNALKADNSIQICYITSAKDDPILTEGSRNVDVVYLKSSLAFLFSRLQADVMVLTMPDLQNFILKKSSNVKKYIYVFHAVVSIHQQYRAHAFDHFNAIFSVGPHHNVEIRESEALYQLSSKELVNYGYPLLNALDQVYIPVEKAIKKVWIAPSWYQEGILQTCILEILEVLATLSLDVYIRPHPEFIKREKKKFQAIQKLIATSNHLYLDREPNVYNSIKQADYLITDRSGIAYEYAMVQKRKVIFIDKPPKIQNRDFYKFKTVPVENAFRSKVGIIIQPTEINSLPQRMVDLHNQANMECELDSVRKELVFDMSHHQNGLDYILSQLRY